MHDLYERHKYPIWLSVIALIFIAICSYTSPLFYFDYSPDNNCFFTVGKAMMHNIIPYKDVFDQKGPYVYLLHGIASLLSPKSLVGVFPFEIVSIVVTMVLTYHIAQHFFRADWVCFLATLFTASLYLYHPYFDYGDTVESLTYPITVYLIYLILKYGRLKMMQFMIPQGSFYIQGLLIGVIFLSKYTLLGEWIPFELILFGYYLKHHMNHIARGQVEYGLAGFGTALLPWAVYFTLTDSWHAFLHAYFYVNLVEYPLDDYPFISKLLRSLVSYEQFVSVNFFFILFGIVLTVYILYSNIVFKNRMQKVLYASADIGCVLLQIVGAVQYEYYFLAFFPYFILPMLCGLKLLLENVPKEYLHGNIDRRLIIGIMVGVSFLCLLGVNNNVLSTRFFPNNASVTKHTGITGKHMVPAQVKFGRIIDRTTGEHTTLLNYGSVDIGVYTASGVMPHNYYFQNYNFNEKKVPYMIDSQRKLLKERKPKWVVLDTPVSKSIMNWRGNPGETEIINGANLNSGTHKIGKYLLRNYRIVSAHGQSFENAENNYWLLVRRKHSLNKLELKCYLIWNRKHETNRGYWKHFKYYYHKWLRTGHKTHVPFDYYQ